VVKRFVKSGGGSSNRTSSELKAVEADSECHFLMNSNDVVAALDLCSEAGVSGVIVTKSHAVMELLPHRSYMMPEWKNGTSEPSKLHLVRRAKLPRPDLKERANDEKNMVEVDHPPRPDMLHQTNQTDKKVIETAVFLDSTAYKIFSEYFKKVGASNVDLEVKHLLLSYVNGIQALFLLPSLGQHLTISIVRLELATERDPYESHNGEREGILASFCEYQSRLNPRSKKGRPGGWDAAILVTGLDLHEEGASNKGVTLGLAPVGGVCSQSHNCVVGELGVHGRRGQAQPSAGFAAIYVMAHEVGHNLGMVHDDKAGCAKEGFIMSPTRGSTGETAWSECSAEILRKGIGLDCLLEEERQAANRVDVNEDRLPGQIWSPRAQCQIFLLEPSAQPFRNQRPAERCQTIKCSRPGRRGYRRAGPGLEGTECGHRKWCRSGKCVLKPGLSQPPTTALTTSSSTSSTSSITSTTSSTISIMISTTVPPDRTTTARVTATTTKKNILTTTTASIETTTASIETTTSATITGVSQASNISCQPTGIYSQVAGMEAWCRNNCNHNPTHCPRSHCQCHLWVDKDKNI